MPQTNIIKILVPVLSIVVLVNIALGGYIFFKTHNLGSTSNTALASKYTNCSSLLNGGYAKVKDKVVGFDKQKNLVELKNEITMVNGSTLKPSGVYVNKDTNSESTLKNNEILDFQGNLISDADCAEYFSQLSIDKL